jgi:hypothetical protein
MQTRLFFVLGALAATPLSLATAQGGATPPAARSEDVSSEDAIVRALYDVISGPAGQKRDWDRMRSLFAPGARMMPTGRDSTGAGRMVAWTPDDYIQRSGDFLEKNGFFEQEIGRTEDRYGNIAQVFSTYESRHTAADAKPFMRGINSIQLWFDGKRWWIVNIFWEGESPKVPIPAKYIQKR